MKIINHFKLRHLFQAADFRFAGHRHARYEANIILDGRIELTCGNDVFCLEKENFAVWKPEVFHMSRVVSPQGAELLAIEFDLDDDTFTSGESAIFKLNPDDISLANLIKKSDGEAQIRLTEAFFIRLSDRDCHAESAVSGLSEVYRDAVNYMAKNLCLDINVATVAKHCGVCMTTLKKAFSEYANKGVRAYFIEMKLHRAKEMLASGKGVSETSDALGFSSPAYFSQCFKSHEKISPIEYRKSRA